MSSLAARLLHAVTLGTVTVLDDTQALQRLQISETARAPDGQAAIIDNVPRVTEFGFTSSPPIGSTVIAIRIFGNRTITLAIGTSHAASRIKNLSPGDTAIYDVRGAYIKLTAAGLVIDCAGLPMTVQNLTVLKVAGPIQSTGDVVANVGGNAVSLAGHDHGITGGPKTTAPLPE